MRTKGQGLDFQSLVLNRGIQLEQPISSTHIVKYLNNLFDKSIPRRKNYFKNILHIWQETKNHRCREIKTLMMVMMIIYLHTLNIHHI